MKPLVFVICSNGNFVAPYTGAWIETVKRVNLKFREVGSPLHGGVD